MKLDIASINDEDREFIVRYISRNWGSSVIVTRGKVHRTEELPGFVALMDREIKGIVTYNIYESDCEIVSLDNLSERCGVGSSLIEKVTSIAQQNHCRKIWLITTNDNVHAIRFYQIRGFDLVALHRFAVNEARRIKPQIPFIGIDDIPILHEIEFEKVL
jgi:GNAT superfamily N-acetyltransferase